MDFSNHTIKLWNMQPKSDGSLDSTEPFNTTSTPVAGNVPVLPNRVVSSSSFTITGSGFGTKAQAAPIKFDQFQAYADDTTLQSNDAAWEQYQTNGGGLIKSDRPRYAGGKYAYNDSTRSGFATNFHTFDPADEVFLSYWFSTDQATYGAGGTYWVGKLSRITNAANGVYNGVGVHALSNQNPQNQTNPYLYQYNGTNTLGEVIDYVTVPQDNEWVRVDMYVKLSDLDTANGVFNCRTWGYEDYQNNAVPSRVTGNDYQLDSVILGLMHANHAGASGGLKITDVYIDNTLQRVELTDSADYASSTWSEIQPCDTWSDTSISGQLNTGGRSGTAYLHVINASGISIVSQEVSLGGRTVLGSGFGVAPTVVHFDSFSDVSHQAQITLDSPEIGSYSRYNNITAGNSNNAWGWIEDGRGWLAHRNPAQLSSSTSNLSSLIIDLQNTETEFLFGFRWRIAEGYRFPTSSQNNVVENVSSNLKQNWFWNSAHSDLAGDIVIPTFNSANAGAVTGNAFRPVSTAGGQFGINHAILSGTDDNFFSYYQSNNSGVGVHDATVELRQHSGTTHHVESYDDVDPFDVNSGAYNPAGYDRIAVNGWQGNGDFANSLLLYADVYLAVGANARARIMTHDQPTLSASNEVYLITADSWSDTQITYTPRAHEDLAYITVISADGTVQEGLSHA